MKRKYFFFDIDGTLGLKLTKQLPADTAYCLKRLGQKGIVFTKRTLYRHCDRSSPI